MTRFRSTVPMLAWLLVICWACGWAADPEHFDVSAYLSREFMPVQPTGR